MKRRLDTKQLLIVLSAAIFLTLPVMHVSAWQYGPSMTPTTSQYDSIEMPTNGLFWSTAPSGGTVSTWVSSTTTGNNFAQNGFIYNGSNACVKVTDDSQHCVPANSWAMFYTYTISGVYHGDVVLPPAGWNHGDQIYFSIAAYPSKGEFAFLFKDSTNGQSITVAVCQTAMSGSFTGNVGGLSESTLTSNLGNIYVDHIALWAQIQSTGRRNSGNTNAFCNGTPPSSDLIFIYAANDAQLGFNSGTHYSCSSSLWTANLGANNENFPVDLC